MPTGIGVAVENPLPVRFAGQPVIVYAMGSVTPSLPIVRLSACTEEQATACTAFLVHFTEGDVLPASVVAGVSVPKPAGLMLKDIEPPIAEPHVFAIPGLAVTPEVPGIVATMVFVPVQVGQFMVNDTA